MPVRDNSPRQDVREVEALRAELKAELANPKPAGEPEIIIERPSDLTVHLFVIWEKWKELEQRVRSKIIQDVYSESRPEEADDVTVAMGLTRAEAEKMGIK